MVKRNFREVDAIIIIDGKVVYQGKVILKEKLHATPWTRTVNGKKHPAALITITMTKDYANRFYDVILIPRNEK